MRQWAAVRVAWGAECTNAVHTRMQKALHETTQTRLGNLTGPVLFSSCIRAHAHQVSLRIV